MLLKFPYEIILEIEKHLNIEDSLNIRLICNNDNKLKTVINNKILYIYKKYDFQFYLYYLFFYTDMIQYLNTYFIDYNNENIENENIISSYVLSDLINFDIVIYLYRNKKIYIKNQNLKTGNKKEIIWDLLEYKNLTRPFLYFNFINKFYKNIKTN